MYMLLRHRNSIGSGSTSAARLIGAKGTLIGSYRSGLITTVLFLTRHPFRLAQGAC